jgi:hypothetical protein
VKLRVKLELKLKLKQKIKKAANAALIISQRGAIATPYELKGIKPSS